MKYLAIVCFVLSGIVTSFAQKQGPKGIKRNQVLFSINNGICFNKFNIYNNGIYPDPIEVPSAITYKPSIMLVYQRITSYGLMYGGGFQYGVYSHDVDVNYKSLDFLDTMQELKNQSYKFSYRNKSPYLGLHLFIGYAQPLNRKKQHPAYLEAKLAVTKRLYFSGGYSEVYLNGQVLSNDTIFAGYTAAYIDNGWGNNKRMSPNFLEGYIGFRKNTGWRYVNDISIGIFGTYQFEIPGVISTPGPFETLVRNGHYLHGVFQYYDNDYYLNKEVTFGIRAGFGLSF